MVQRSKWGWHPCDRSTYLLLKKLNRLCEKAQRQHAAWHRWNRKAPHNRLVRRTLLDGNGSRIGREVVGPQPEPTLTAPFCIRRQVLSRWGEDGRPLKTGRLVDTVEFHDHGVPEAYRLARHPKATPEEVEHLPLSQEEVRRLAEQTGLVDRSS
jgi:hypothetical protein